MGRAKIFPVKAVSWFEPRQRHVLSVFFFNSIDSTRKVQIHYSQIAVSNGKVNSVIAFNLYRSRQHAKSIALQRTHITYYYESYSLKPVNTDFSEFSLTKSSCRWNSLPPSIRRKKSQLFMHSVSLLVFDR